MRNAERIESAHDEEHIVSVIVHIKQTQEGEFNKYISQHENLEVVTRDDKGRHILVVSAPTPRQAINHIEVIQSINGVLSASMVAHYSEQASSLDEEVEMSELTELEM